MRDQTLRRDSILINAGLTLINNRVKINGISLKHSKGRRHEIIRRIIAGSRKRFQNSPPHLISLCFYYLFANSLSYLPIQCSSFTADDTLLLWRNRTHIFLSMQITLFTKWLIIYIFKSISYFCLPSRVLFFNYYRQLSDIRRTKSQTLNVSSLVV